MNNAIENQVSRDLARIAHALEALARSADPNFKTEAEESHAARAATVKRQVSLSKQ